MPCECEGKPHRRWCWIYQHNEFLSSLKDPAILFLIQVINYAVVCVSYRSLAQANMLVTVSIDFGYGWMQFYIIQRIAKSPHNFLGALGYAAGGAVGTWLGILISLKVLGR